MNMKEMRWVLAFDGSCGYCREVSRAVSQACAGKLEVMPLASGDVRKWREQSVADPTRRTPTLLRVQEANVRAWTGAGMVVPLTRHLGIRSTVAVVIALGRMRRNADARSTEDSNKNMISRSRFLQFAAGIVAAGTVIGGTARPASAEGDTARSWARANAGQLPTEYDDFAGYSMVYRRAIYAKLESTQKRQLWREHLRRYVATHSNLSTEQLDLVKRASSILADESYAGLNDANRAEFDELREASIQLFGAAEARAIFATLGPVEVSTAGMASECECSTVSVYCGGCICMYHAFECYQVGECGFFWNYVCDGMCSTDC
ncbi:MAG: bacteriocin fulvocin C-related protein [Labedaea sp.]